MTTDLTPQPAGDELHRLPGGATRSEKAPGYHLVPLDSLKRVAKRFDLGAEKHGANNWKKSIPNRLHAHAFCLEAYNHMLEHQRKMIAGEDPDDDHLGAIGWCVAVLCYVEAFHGQKWTELDDIPF